MKHGQVSRGVRRGALLAVSIMLVLQLAACGGGSQVASGGIVGTGAQDLAVQGAITALGDHTIVVNGQTTSTVGAAIMINGQPAPDTALKVGMVVTILTTLHSSGAGPTTTIEYRAEVQGIVSGVDPSAQTFTVLGQRVQTNQLTIFAGGTFDTLLNQVVEVSGFRSTPGDLLATLVIVKPNVPPPSAPQQVTGVVSSLNATARTFVIGLQLCDYSKLAVSAVPADLADGATVRVDGMLASVGGTLVADSITVLASTLPDAGEGEVEGFITVFAGLGSFKVNGQMTDARNAVIEGGTAATLANGVLVDVEGRLAGGVLIATKLEIEAATIVRLDGTVQAVDATAGSVTIGGQTVTVTTDTQYIDSSTAAVRNFSLLGVHVGDHLSILASRTASNLIATSIERLDLTAPPPNQPPTTISGSISNFVSIANFTVAGQRVNAGAAAFVGGTSANLANGVSVQVDGTLVSGTLNASTITFLATPPPSSVTITGSISAFVSVSNFTVAGQVVDASSASFSNGNATNLANGVNVTVKGTIQSSTLLAQSVSFVQPPPTTFEVQGSISNFAGVSSFVVAGQPVNASQATISNGTAANLANGVQVQVNGTLQNGVLVATTVQIESSSEPQEISVQGLITNFVSVSNFVVAGRAVDASSAQFNGGTAANLANGVSVQVSGFLNGQVLKAKELEFDD